MKRRACDLLNLKSAENGTTEEAEMATYEDDVPVAMHQIVAWIAQGGESTNVSDSIDKLLPQSEHLSKHVMLQNIIKSVASGGVNTTNLEAGHIFRRTNSTDARMTEALAILKTKIERYCSRKPGEFISRIGDNEFVYDIVVYLFKDAAKNQKIVRARFKEFLEAWFEEMDYGSDLLTQKVAGLITELTQATYIKSIDQYDFKKIVLKTLTAKANPCAVKMVEMIVSQEDIAEEEVLEYIESDRNTYISPCFVLQYISHIQNMRRNGDEWATRMLLNYFFNTRHTGTRLHKFYAETASLSIISARPLYRIVLYMWSRPELKPDASRFASAVLRKDGRHIFKNLIREALIHREVTLINELPKGFTPGPKAVWEECRAEIDAEMEVDSGSLEGEI
ncbi:hypothetical protein PAPHI01_0436 [Pancytospora philotis]|nr:hypothetical protein PAPHI01_0436 [Pancytospora philotis]